MEPSNQNKKVQGDKAKISQGDTNVKENQRKPLYPKTCVGIETVAKA